MAQWIGVQHNGEYRFGKLVKETVVLCTGSMFDSPEETDETFPFSDAVLDIPCSPTKVVALWNNSRGVAMKHGLEQPDDPLVFIKTSNTYLPSGGVIRKPNNYDGRVIFEAELGIVIGREVYNASHIEAAESIFGYTCINDVTAIQIIGENDNFAQWTRAKNFNTFTPMGPTISSDVELADVNIRAELNGRERQNYTLSDLFFGPEKLVHLISSFMTLYPGDIISCGTGLGSLPMRPGMQIDVTIDGIGTLSNTFCN